MLSTVVAELATPRVVAAFGYRIVLSAGVVLLGVPALALPYSASMTGTLGICVVRGVGVAIAVVLGGSLVASTVPSERRGEGLGLYGVVVGVPAVVGLPLGVWLAAQTGYGTVFVTGAMMALAVLVVVPGIPTRAQHRNESLGLLRVVRSSALLRPSILFAATTIAAGVVVTFLPLAIANASGNVAAIGLLVQAVAATISRWWAGHHGDRHGSSRLLVPSVLLAASGMIALIAVSNVTAMMAGMVLFGTGFGIAQNASLSLMFERVTPAAYDAVSALWNLAYDAGLGVGAAGFGMVAAWTGYPAMFASVAALMIVVTAIASRGRQPLTEDAARHAQVH
jgi:predicted MFS family arabinose efflux permease